MEEMMNYIFKGILDSQEGIKQINKKLKMQSKYNRQVGAMFLLSAGLGYIMSMEIKEQKKEIRNLRDQVDSFRIERMRKDVKTPKGE